MPKPARSQLPVVSPAVTIERHIHLVRGHKVMLDFDLAALYGVLTGNMNLAVRRNQARFPEDFMFKLTRSEADNLILQSAISSSHGGRRHLPLVFTELGVAMLSSVLSSERAVQMNMTIMRAFVRLRNVIAHNKKIATRIEKLEQGQRRVASVIEVLVDDIDRVALDVRKLKALPAPRRRKLDSKTAIGSTRRHPHSRPPQTPTRAASCGKSRKYTPKDCRNTRRKHGSVPYVRGS